MKRRSNSAGVRFGRKAERGIALVLVMMFLALLMTLGLASTMGSITEVEVNSNTRLAMEAFNTAEAGSVHGYELVRNMSGDFSWLLNGNVTTPSNSTLHDGDEFVQRPAKVWKQSSTAFVETNPPKPMFDESKVALPVVRSGRTFWRMTPRHFYELLVYDNASDAKSYLTNAARELATDTGNRAFIDGDFRVLIRSVGYVMREDTSLDGFNPLNAVASAVVDTVVGLAPYPAVITRGDLRMGNSASVTGTLGGVHANDDLTLALSGSGYIEQGATFANTTSDTAVTGSNDTADNTRVDGFNGPSDELPLPDLNPYDFANKANLALVHAETNAQERDALINGLAKDSNGVLITTRRDDLVGLITAASIAADDHFAISITYSAGLPTYVVTKLGTGNYRYTNGAFEADFKTSGGSKGFAIDQLPNPSPAPLGSGLTVFTLVPGANASTSFNGGTTGVITVLTNGNVGMNGNSRLKPNLQILPPEQPPWNQADLLVLAGQDIIMSGSSTGSDLLEGVMYAHEQFHLTGGGNIAGQIVGYDKELEFLGTVGTLNARYASHATSRHRAGTPWGDGGQASEVDSNFEVIHDFSRGYIGGFSQSAWRQLRDFNAMTDAR